MRSLFWVCAVLVVILGVMSTNLWGELRTEREAAQALQTQVAEAVGRERAVAPITLPAAPVTGAATPYPLPSDADVAAAQAIDAQVRLRKAEDQRREMWKDPDYRKARLAQARSSIARSNPDLAQELGLSPAEADALFDLLAEFDLDRNSTMLGSAASDPSAIEDAMKQQQEISRRRDAGIAAQLGSARYALWQQYQQDAPARSQADSLNGALARAAQPLDERQLKVLTAALVTEARRQREDAMELTGKVNSRDPAAWAQIEEETRQRREQSSQRVLAAAAPVMSAEQLAIVRAQMEQQDVGARIVIRARNPTIGTPTQGAQ